MNVLWQFNPELKIYELLPEEKEGDKDVMCAEFGCGKHLTPGEQLFGDYCGFHSKDRKKKLTEIIERYI